MKVSIDGYYKTKRKQRLNRFFRFKKEFNTKAEMEQARNKLERRLNCKIDFQWR